MPPQVHHSEVTYRGRAFSVRVDQVEIKPGVISRLDIIDHPDAVTILPLDADGQIWFIRQFRHAAADALLELPAGTLKPDEDPAEAANRELQEEIGMKAAHLQPLSQFWLAPGYSTELMHVFIATGLSASQLQQDEDEDITIEKIPAADVVALVLSGGLRDAKSLVAVLTAARQLNW
jgi:ADP-ribose pyrophosphatase